MKYLSVLIFLASTLLFSSCAKNIITNYQDKTENTGDLMVIPNKPVFNASITLREMINKDVNKLNDCEDQIERLLKKLNHV